MAKSTTLLEKIWSYGDEAVDRLIGIYQRKERWQGLMRGLAAGLQRVEDDAYDVLFSTILELAGGDALDQWGRMVGEPREGLTDGEYRPFIEARILANLSDGTPGDLIQIYGIITEANRVLHWDHYPAGFRLTAFRDDPMGEMRVDRVVRMMRDIKPGGIQMVLCEALTGALQMASSGPPLGSSLSRVLNP